MHDDIAIKVEHVSKKYCKSLKRSMLYGIYDIARNTIGLSSHSDRLRPSEFWALDDVSFELKKGEILGMIGPNGAGKTTLLKLLNGIFWPDKGKITVKGRVGALIQVGAGFHPLLTGRENIYVNGAILGMSKKEVDRKFKSIVEFADIGDFLDMPVKHYSSGMFVRLGFAVAVHCEPDILLIDEVLAVGDLSFRAKCYQKIGQIRKSQNITVILISHSMGNISNFCDRVIYLSKGYIKGEGFPSEVIPLYKRDVSQKELKQGREKPNKNLGNKLRIRNVRILDGKKKEKKVFRTGDSLIIQIEYETRCVVKNPCIEIAFRSAKGITFIHDSTRMDSYHIPTLNQQGIIEIDYDYLNLSSEALLISIAIWNEDRTELLEWKFKAYEIEVHSDNSLEGVISVPHRWQHYETKLENFY